MLILPMFAIGELINIMQCVKASLDRVSDTLSYKPDVADASEPVHVEEPLSLKFWDVTFRYPTSTVDNLACISFTLRER